MTTATTVQPIIAQLERLWQAPRGRLGWLAAVNHNWQAHDTCFVVAHFHYVLIGGAVFPLLAGVYYWFPKLTGKSLHERLDRWNFGLTVVGFHVAFFPMCISGIRGMPRRIYTYLAGVGWDE